MFFRSLRRRGGPVAALTLSTFVLSSLPHPALAATAAPTSQSPAPQTASTQAADPAPDSTPAAHGLDVAAAAAQTAAPGVAGALIGVDPATGAARTSISFELPQARGGPQPALSLNYSSSNGPGFGGMGWSLDIPSIERRNTSSFPRFVDFPVGTPPMPPAEDAGVPIPDDFSLGGQPLVPICLIGPSGTCTTGSETGTLPTRFAGWTYYHPQVDTFERVFRSPTSTTWVAQLKNGNLLEFGVPLDNTSDSSGLETYSADVGPGATVASVAGTYRWDLVRQVDPTGTNVVMYSWAAVSPGVDGDQPTHGTLGLRYLTDIYDTFGLDNGTVILNPAFAAHHTHLFWRGSDAVLPYSPGWRSTAARVLGDVAITSATMTEAAGGARSLVRLYHLTYTDPKAYEQRFLVQSQQYGCSATETNGNIADPATWAYSPGACPTLPPTSFFYENPVSDGWPARTLVKVSSQTMTGVPGDNFATGYSSAAMVDVDGDGLGDLLEGNGPATNEIGLFSNAYVRLGSNPGVEWPINLDKGTSNGGPRYAFPGGMLPTLRTYWGDWFGSGVPTLLFMNNALGDYWWSSASSIYGVPPTPPGIGDSAEVYWFGGIGTLTNGSPSSTPDWSGWGPCGGTNPDGTGYCAPVVPFYSDGENGNPDYSEGYDIATYGYQGKAFDIDGDGLLDIAQIPESRAYPVAGVRRSYFTVRPSDGNVLNGIWGRKVFSASLVNYNESGYHAVADMDADGLDDIVEVEQIPDPGPSTFGTETTLRWWKNRGDGRFGVPPPAGGYSNSSDSGQPAVNDVPVTLCETCTWPVNQHASNIAVGDVNGDSLADFVVLYEKTLRVYLQNPRAYIPGGFANPPLTFASATADDNAAVSIAPVDGTGMPFIVVQDGNVVSTFQLQSSLPQYEKYGLLTTMADPLGRQTTVTYDSVAHLGLIASPAWTKKLPAPTMVVTSSKTSSSDQEPDGTFDSYVTTYAYVDPFYDGRDHSFTGFRQVTVTTQGTAASPGTVTTTSYVTPTPPVSGAQLGNYTGDDGWPMLRQLPYAVQVSDAVSGQLLSATVTTWRYTKTHAGADGVRFSRMIYPAQVDTFPGGVGQTSSTTTLGGVESLSELDKAYVFAPAAPIAVPGSIDIRRSQGLDDAGNVVDSFDWGVVGTDTAILTETTWGFGTGDTSGWSYRPTKVQVGYATAPVVAFTGPVREVDHAFDDYGRLTSTSAPLSGTVALSRSNPGGTTAPAPTNASADSSSITLASYYYDPYGNVTSIQSANRGCVSITYDAEFEQLPVSSSAYTSGCSGASLTSTATYDRGFGAVTSVFDPSLAETVRKYDVFGRLTEVDQPSAATSGTTDSTPALTVDWSLYPSFLHLTTPARESYVAYDSFGRVRHRLDSAETAGVWIASGIVQLYPSGRVQKAYLPFDWSGATNLSEIAPTTNSSSFTYDAVGRLLTSTGPDGVVTASLTYGALSTQMQDGDQVTGAPRYGSYSTVQYDGHGRTAASIQTLANGPVDQITQAMAYLATGEVSAITRSHTADTRTFTRTMQYDSLGRLVQNVEPNTSWSDLVGTKEESGAWTYAYDDAGDLVGTSDARGCGENLAYDGLGRITSEDYSPCTAVQSGYTSLPEVSYVYDVGEGPFVNEDVEGKLTAVYDRASHTQLGYDARGRVTNVNKQIAHPPDLLASSTGPVSTTYAPHFFEQAVVYDEANRVFARTTGADPAVFGLTTAPYVQTNYTPRGTIGSVTGSYGTLLASQTFNPDGTVAQRVLGDAAATTTDFTYYLTGRVATIHVHRPTGPWVTGSGYAAPSNNLEDDLENLTIQYDAAGNPWLFSDASTAKWPAGSLPYKFRELVYGDDYRVTQVIGSFGSGVQDPFISPYAPEVAAGSDQFPQLVSTPNRLQSQTFAYDWLGNTTQSTDDANVFVDRSLGTITNGGGVVPVKHSRPGPDHLTSATLGGSTLSVGYDDAGNVTEIAIARAAPCPGSCDVTYSYTWDEVGHLSTATRTEGTATPVSDTYEYDASGNRVLQMRVSDGATKAPTFTANVFDTLRLEDTTFPDANGDYVRSTSTEAEFLVAGGVSYGRVVYSQSDPTLSASGTEHVFLEVGDHLGSTSFVIDKATGELVEHPTYQAYGAAESDFRSPRWANFREVFRHTGHEDGAEVGVVNFGQRHYSTILGRWLSPDPLAIHGLGGDLNPYAFTNGSPMRFVDPFGLAGCDKSSQSCADGSNAVDESPEDWTYYSGGGYAGGNGGGAVGPADGAQASNAAAVYAEQAANRAAAANRPPPPPPARTANPRAATPLESDLDTLLHTPVKCLLLGSCSIAEHEHWDDPPPDLKTKEGWNQALEDFLHRGFMLGGVAEPAANVLEEIASSRVLGRALQQAGFVRQEGDAAHHIVAGSAAAAAPARAVLSRFGIGINDAVNGAFLPGNRVLAIANQSGAIVHAEMHTAGYYALVNDLLLGATTREEAISALNTIRDALLAGKL